MSSRGSAASLVLVLGMLALIPVVAHVFDEPFYIQFATRAIILALAATSLGLILGYGGMASFGHASFLGVGGYAVVVLVQQGVSNGFVQLAVAVAAAAFAALVIGAVSLRTAGVYFIMITLAFSQMLYYLASSLRVYGGDDGTSIMVRANFGPLDLGNDVTLYYVALGILAISLVVIARIADSWFGTVLRGAKTNERRMLSLGFTVYNYRLVAFVMSGALCGIAGFLLANHSQYVSPAIMHWTRSGELLIMVILGGLGTLLGPVIGALMLLTLEQLFSAATDHWQGFVGTVLVLVTLLSRTGVAGLVPRIFGELKWHRLRSSASRG